MLTPRTLPGMMIDLLTTIYYLKMSQEKKEERKRGAEGEKGRRGEGEKGRRGGEKGRRGEREKGEGEAEGGKMFAYLMKQYAR